MSITSSANDTFSAQVNAASFVVAGAGNSAGAATLNLGPASTRRAAASSQPANAGPITIITTGEVGVAGQLAAGADSSVNTTTGVGGNGGNVTINAATVRIGGDLNPSTFASIFTRGFDTTTAGQTAGSAGNVSITATSTSAGSNIGLSAPINATGGNASVTGTGNAGAGGNVTLNATSGSVVIANFNFETAPIELVASGGTSTSGNAGAGGNVNIHAGGTISSTGGANTSGLTAGAITITAGGGVALGIRVQPPRARRCSPPEPAQPRPGQGAGSGANVSITAGTSITIGTSIVSNGGSALVTGAVGAGGNAGT